MPSKQKKHAVKYRYIGIPHFMAVCHSCEWQWEDAWDRQKGVREIRKHVARTGHTVSLEKAVCVQYEAVPAEMV